MAGVFTVECQGCDFKQSIIGHNDYAYRLEKPPDVYLWKQYAWCSSCQGVVPAERLLPSAESEEYLTHTPSPKLRQNAERYQQIIAFRESPARCLNCGGTEIIPASGDWPEYCVTHPDCGADIILRYTGSAPQSRETAVYSSEGEFLLKADGILLPGRGYR